MNEEKKRNSNFKFLKFMLSLFSILVLIDSIIHIVNAIPNSDNNEIIINSFRIVMSVIEIAVVFKESKLNKVLTIYLTSIYAVFMIVFMFTSPIFMDFNHKSISLIAQIIATYLSLVVSFKLIVSKFLSKLSDGTEEHQNSGDSSHDLTNTDFNLSFGNKKKSTLKKVFLILDDNLLAFSTLVTVIIAISLGSVLKETSPHWNSRTLKYVGFLGEIFLRMLKALILPLVFSSIVFAMSNIETRLLGKIGVRIFIYYFTTTVLAIVLSIILVLLISPGTRSTVSDDLNSDFKSSQTIFEDNAMDLIRNLFPDNLIEACFKSYHTVLIRPENETIANKSDIHDWDIKSSSNSGVNILGIVMFAVVLGIIIGQMDESEGKVLKDFFKSFGNAILKITGIVIQLTPICILFLVLAQVLAVEDITQLIGSVGWYALTVTIGVLIHGLIVLPSIYFVLTRNNPYKFLLRMSAAIFTAFGTSSSSATMPVTIQCLEERNGIDKRIVRFSIPLGSTINMDGAAVYETVACIFIAQYRGVELSYVQVLIVAITATVVSVGAAGIPQGAAIMLVIVLNSVGLPIEDAALVFVVDWFLDRIVTVLNVMGDAFGAGVVHHYSKDDLQSLQALDISL